MPMKRSRLRKYGCGLLILSGALAVGITPQVASGAKPVDTAVEFLGCTATRGTAPQFTCMLVPDDQLTLWVGNRDCKDVQAADSGQPIKAALYSIQGGCQLRLPPALGVHKSTLTLADRRSQQVFWTLPLDRSRPYLLEWKRRIWDRASLNPEDVLPDLQLKVTEAPDAEGLIDAAYALAIANQRLGNRDESVRQYSHVIQLAEKAGYRSIAMEAGYRRTFQLRQVGLMPEARASLAQMSRYVTPGEARGTSYQGLEDGLFDRAEERFDLALTKFEQVYAAASRVNDRVIQLPTLPLLAEALMKAGRTDTAEQLLTETEPLLDGQTVCKQSGLLSFAAHISLRLRLDTGRVIPIGRMTTREALLRARDLEQQCTTSINRAPIFLFLAQIARMDGRYSEAQEWLAKSKAASDASALIVLEQKDEEALLALAEGRLSEAYQLFQAVDATSQKQPGTFPQDYRCKAAIGMAEARFAMGQLTPQLQDAVRTCLSPPRIPDILLFRLIERRARAIGVIAP